VALLRLRTEERALLAIVGFDQSGSGCSVLVIAATPSRTVHPYYTPPECCVLADHSEKSIIHRSGDIWSLGCIIAEVVTYMLWGVKEVEDFEEQRKFKEGPSVKYRFHCGDTENPAVTAWIEKLQRSDSLTQMLGQLVQQMLQLHHQDRPQAREVESRMRFIAIVAACRPIQKIYQDIGKEDDSIQPTLERARFDSWRYVLNSNINKPRDQMYESANYSLVHQTLGQIHDELQVIQVNCKNPRSRIYEPLRQRNDLLLDCLSDEGQDRARVYLDTQMLLEPSDVVALASISQDEDISLPQIGRLRMMASVVKCVTEVVEGRPAHVRSIDRDSLGKKAEVGDFKIQYLKSEIDESKTQVVVKSKTYQDHYGDVRIATELQKRLEDITELLKRANDAAGKDRFRVLRCAGFFHDPSTYSCGLAYEFPPLHHQTLRSSLRCDLRLKRLKRGWRTGLHLSSAFSWRMPWPAPSCNFTPSSGCRRACHPSTWPFFHSSKESWWKGIANPYFLGFLYSRSNENNAFTEGPTEDAHHRDYQHPDCRGKGVKNPRYRTEYDYCSLTATTTWRAPRLGEPFWLGSPQ
jgi:hypothetical protein